MLLPPDADLNFKHVLMTFNPCQMSPKERHLHTFQPSFCQPLAKKSEEKTNNVTFFFCSHRFSFRKTGKFDVFLANMTFNREGKTYIICPIFVKIFCSRNQKKSLGNYPLQKTVKNRETSELECLFFVDEKMPKGKGTRIRVERDEERSRRAKSKRRMTPFLKHFLRSSCWVWNDVFLTCRKQRLECVAQLVIT